MSKEEEIAFVEKAQRIYESFQYDSVNKAECIRAYKEWYAMASVLFNRYIDDNNKHLLKFESVDNSGNGCTLRSNYDEIYASYCVLIDTIRTMGEGEFVSLVKEEDSQYGEVILYQPNDSVRLEVRLQDETVWLTQQQMAELFGTTRNNITLHIGNIFKEGELEEKSVRKESLLTAADGKRYKTKFYNLDVIISVGYRVKSKVGTHFRQWALAVLKDYLLRGFAVHHQAQALQQINLRIDSQNDRLSRIENTIDHHQQQLDFVIRANEKPEEIIIPTGCVWDGYTFVCDLIRSAKEQILLVDNYVDDRVLTMLDKREEGVKAEVYTRYSEHVKLDFEKHNKQYTAILFVQLSHAVHDRYLIIDDSVWLLGTSMKDVGKGLTTIIKVDFSADFIMDKVKS